MTATPNFPLTELHIVGVANPGKPNVERIVIRPTQQVNLNGYGIALGVSAGLGARPMLDNCFWFPEVEVVPPSWILVYTGKGVPHKSQWQGTDVLIFHWQRDYVVFTREIVVPVLFRIAAATVGHLLTEPFRGS
jgi:hypothetical protein